MTGPGTFAAYRSRVVAARDLSPDDVAVWRRIQTGSEALASPFYSATFTTAVASVGIDARVGIFADDHGPRAFLPFQFATRMHRFLGAAERVGGEMSDYFGLIADRGVRLTPAAVLRACRLNSFYLTHLDETQQEFGLTGGKPEVGHRIVIGGDAAAFWAQLQRENKRFVSDLKRRESNLVKRHGPLRFEFSAACPGPELDRLVAEKRAQYARTGALDALRDDGSIRLLMALAQSSDPSCRGVLSTLHAGETWVASHFGLLGSSVLHYWFPVYSADLREFSPGHLLIRAIINISGEVGVRTIDRGAGDQQAKREFANARHSYFRDLWHRANLPGLGVHAYHALRWRM